MKKILTIIFASFALVSCIDTEILPDDKTVEEDFWQTKSDVEMMVNGAYTSFATADNLRKIIVWTSRSDELKVNTSLNRSDLNQIENGSIQTTNAYLGWGGFYSAINNCNLVISKSEEVRNIDPNYLQGDHNNNVGQMLALRALSYFYLIRAFRDVPLVTEPYKNSSQINSEEYSGTFVQTPAATVLDQIISDLERAKGMVLASDKITNWERCGKITTCGVYAILADAYLWRASITGSQSDYRRCIECCDYIRNNRSVANAAGASVEKDDKYNLNDYSDFFNPFSDGRLNNDSEILLEMIFEDNAAVCEMYNQNKYASSTQDPLFFTNNVYAVMKNDADHVFKNSAKDVRACSSIYGFGAEGEDGTRIRKYVAKNGLRGISAGADCTAQNYVEADAGKHSHTDNSGNIIDPTLHPWIIYRVTDVMLMKAEAMVQLAKLMVNTEEVQGLVAQLRAASSDDQKTALTAQLWPTVQTVSALNVTGVRQVQIVNTRATTDGNHTLGDGKDSTSYVVSYKDGLEDRVTQIADYLDAAKYNSLASDLETLVMDERARELCFEGRRWYDMLRYYYRQLYYNPQVTLNYNAVLATLGGNQAPVTNEMRNLMGRKLTSGGISPVTLKIVSEPWLYFPIQQSEIELNSNLMQNPVYSANSTSEKNY